MLFTKVCLHDLVGWTTFPTAAQLKYSNSEIKEIQRNSILHNSFFFNLLFWFGLFWYLFLLSFFFSSFQLQDRNPLQNRIFAE